MQNQGGYLKLGQSHTTRLALTSSFFSELAVPEIFDFKHNIGASNRV